MLCPLYDLTPLSIVRVLDQPQLQTALSFQLHLRLYQTRMRSKRNQQLPHANQSRGLLHFLKGHQTNGEVEVQFCNFDFIYQIAFYSVVSLGTRARALKIDRERKDDFVYSRHNEGSLLIGALFRLTLHLSASARELLHPLESFIISLSFFLKSLTSFPLSLSLVDFARCDLMSVCPHKAKTKKKKKLQEHREEALALSFLSAISQPSFLNSLTKMTAAASFSLWGLSLSLPLSRSTETD